MKLSDETLPRHSALAPNFSEVTLGELDLYFSYATLVAFRAGGKLVVRVNDWSATTGKHLNAIDGGDKKSRLEATEFVEAYRKAMKGK
jgi:hypothetical protein